MKLSRMLLASAATIGLGLAGIAATPEPAFANTQAICPGTANTALGAGSTGQTNCNLIITFNADGSISTSVPTGATANYDGSEDAMIGVINNSSSTINSFNVTGSGIFGFESTDGISTYLGITPTSGNPDTTGYGGPDAWFTNINTASIQNSGTVNFLNGIPTGGTNYFSLEQSISSTALPTVTSAPEPAALALFGAGLFGLAAVRRKRRS